MSDQPNEWDETRDARPPVLDVHKAALQEIDIVVGNEDHLDSEECARLRGILSAALSERHQRSCGTRKADDA